MSSIRTAAAAVALLAPLAVGAPAGAGHDGSGPHARAADDSCPAGRVSPAHFVDVPRSNAHAAAIDCVVWWGVAGGRSVQEYAPAPDVRRGQMATFLRNLVLESGGELPEPTKDHFADDDGTPHEASINALAEAGIVAGRAGGYAPEAPVERGQMATFLVNTYEHRTQGGLAEPTEDVFSDDDGTTHERSTDQAALAGFAAGVGDGRYAPAQLVHRDQMASFLARVLDLLVEDGLAEPPPARAGDFDLGFGSGGVARATFPDEDGDGDTAYAEARDVALGPDGSMALAGVTNGRFAAAKLRADGTLDPAFGGDGMVSTTFPDYAEANAVLLQPDGKVVAGGVTDAIPGFGTEVHLTLVRYLPDGSLDTGFGGDGVVTTALPGQAAAQELVLQSDGKVVAAGTSAGETRDLALARFLPDGTLDPEFGTDGVVVADLQGGHDLLDALVLQPDGALVTAGTSTDGPDATTTSLTLARFLPDGSVDASFGEDGQARATGPELHSSVEGLALRPDGGFVLAGTNNPTPGDEQVLLLGFTADGTVDEAFGESGQVLTSIDNITAAEAVTVDREGRVVVVGYASSGWMADYGTFRWAVLRYRPDGTLDGSYGDGGAFTSRVGKTAYAVEVQPDGRVVAAGCDCRLAPTGRGDQDSSSDMVVARFVAEAPAAQ